MPLKGFTTDGGGEYTSVEFAQFCEKERIEHEIITPYTPQHNGIAKRKNISILNMARSMLKEKKIPNHLWGEATSIAVYIINICQTMKLNNKTPYKS